jgi:S-adenosylmethionine:tRNA ribosyltransferase-isomerase
MTILTERSGVRFQTPPDAFAPAPPEVRGRSRDDVRMLVARPSGIAHHHFDDLADLLDPGDLVVVNNSATVNGEIDAVRRGSPIVLHAASRLDADTWVVELRTSPDAGAPILDGVEGETIGVGELGVTLLEPYPYPHSSPTGSGNRLWRARVEGDLRRLLDRHGRPIAYGYLDRRYPLAAYQSVFSSVPGSAEMASAGRPFTHALVSRLVARGIGVAPITLHTGVSSQEAGEGPQPEWFHVPAATARLVELTRAHGGRVVATGTTVTRALESAVVGGFTQETWGWTERVVTPAHPAAVVTGLITGWHDAQASHLLALFLP